MGLKRLYYCRDLQYRENSRKANKAFREKHGSAFNATVAKYGIEKALEIPRASGRKGIQAHAEKYGSVFNATAQKYGLERAKEIYTENSQSFKKKYGSIFNATLTKYGQERAKEMYRQNMRKANEALMEKYTYEVIQQMRSLESIISARKRGLRTRYPGVLYQKANGKWRVYFSYKGKRYLAGSAYTTEYERQH